MLKSSNNSKVLLEAVRKGYHATDSGDVYGPKGKKLSLFKRSSGYYGFSVRASLNGVETIRNVSVHALIAYQKFGEAIFSDNNHNEVHVRHLDGNPLNNSEDNITIGSQSDNYMDRPQIERIEHASIAAAKVRKFTEEEVKEIRKKNRNGISLNKLSKEYGARKSTLSYIVNRKTYNWVE